VDVRKTLTFVSRMAAYRFKDPVLPWRINLAVTYACNARCVMCNVWKIYRESPNLFQHEMKLEHFDKLFSEVGDHLLWLHITGGEPFLRRDLVDIVKIAAEKCRNLVVVDTSTNGLLPDLIVPTVKQIADLLQERGVVFGIGVSIDGPPEIHNYMRGVEDAWDRAVETLKSLKELEKSYSKLSVHVNYTITSYNAGRLAETYDALQRIVDLDPREISVSIEHSGVQFQNLGKSLNYEAMKSGIMKDLRWVLENSRIGSPFKDSVDWVRNKFKRAFTRLAIRYIDVPSKMVLPCEALRSSVYIDPYGNVYPCTIWGVKLGNVKEKPLRDIIRSDEALRIRRLIAEEKCPNCWSGCESWPTMLLRYWRAVIR